MHNHKKRVLVTGANGLLGANIIKHLSQSEEYYPIAMIRSTCNIISLEGLDCEIYEGELTSEKPLENIISTCDYIIHSAALTKQNIDSFTPYQEFNIDVTNIIIKLCHRYNIQRLVFISTANCFTNGSIHQPGHENSSFMPWLKNVPYAYSKYIAQQHVLDAIQVKKINAIIIAPTFMIGERDAGPSSGQLLMYGLKNHIIFYPPGGKSFVSVDVVAQSVISALKNGKNGGTYLLAGKNMTYKHFFEFVGQLQNKKKLLLPIPKFIFKGLGLLASIIKYTSGKSVVFNSANLSLLTLDNYFSNKKAKQELDMKDTNLTASIHDAMHWFKENHYL